jgi:Kef-type K+ transport system membrane component KefB
MNSTFKNVLFIIFGFLAYLFLAHAGDWDIVAILGALIAGIGISNLSFRYFPNRQKITDWVYPAIILVFFSTIVFFLRTNNYLNLTGLNLNLLQSFTLILTLAPLARLYMLLTRQQDALRNSEK